MRLGKPACKDLPGLARMSDPEFRYEPLGQHYWEAGGQGAGLEVV